MKENQHGNGNKAEGFKRRKSQEVFSGQDGFYDSVNIVDVRAAEDYAEGRIPGAVNLPKDQWQDSKMLKARLRKDKINVLYCYSHVCHLAATAAVEFASKGYPVMELEGGWRWWKNDGFEIEK